MTRITISFLFLAIVTIFLVASKEIISNEPNEIDTKFEDQMAQLHKSVLSLVTRVQKVEDKNQLLEEGIRIIKEKNHMLEEEVQILKEKNQIYEKSNKNLEKEMKDIDDELSYLKELSKLNIVRTCEEMADYGVNQSDFYLIDPDGPLMGEKPISVYCDFRNGIVSTKISHNSEEKMEVQHCQDPGCYSRKITYNAPMEQIQSLIELSKSCSQEIKYECFLSALREEGIDFGFWLDRNGDSQIYWSGSHYGEHVCDCHFTEEGCYNEETLGNSCNCDSIKPSEMSDIGTITNSTALPITELRFGGLEFDAQAAFHTLGKLSCSGKKFVEPKPSSCSSLKKRGFYKNGFYVVLHSYGDYEKHVYCDMTSPGYDNVKEEFIYIINDGKKQYKLCLFSGLPHLTTFLAPILLSNQLKKS